MDIVAKKLELNLVKLSPKIDDLKSTYRRFLATRSDMTRKFSKALCSTRFLKRLSKYSKVAVTGQGADELLAVIIIM